MSSNAIGISFSETMAGGFCMGETEPRTGKDKGDVQATELAMHANIDVPDIDAFIADPEVTGNLDGSIDFPPFGEGIVAPDGVFNLFSPSDDPACKLMVYELGFAHDGDDYYLAGHKEVRNAAVVNMWKATTTLYTRLHRGTDKNGPVAGAGILTLNVRMLIALVSTIKATNARDTREEAEAIMKFGKFFMGELWDTYVKHCPALPSRE